MRRKIRKVLATIAAGAMALSLFPVSLAAAEDSAPVFDDVPDGYTLTPVGTAEELAKVATGSQASNVYYYLTNDITITEESFKGIGTNENTDAFWDVFNGNGYAIDFAGPDGEGVALNGSGTWNGGLFFAINGDAVVENLTVEGTITSTAQSTGALVGQMVNGTIDRCVNRASVTAAGKEGVGGLAGRVKQGIVVNCMNYGSITGGACTGGLVGKVSYATKDINAVSIANCANFGSVTGKEKVGGILGLGQADRTYTIENCYNVGNISETDAVGRVGAIVCSAWPSAVQTVHCYALEGSSSKFLGTTTKMSESDMQASSFAETLNANVAEGIVFADGVNSTEQPVPAVSWQYNEGSYPTIPMVEPVIPEKDLTLEEQMDVIRQRITDYFLRNDAVHSSGAHNGICYISEAGEYLEMQNEDGSWSDVDYYCTQSAANGGVWEPYLALDRMLAMSYAWAKEDGEYYHSQEMADGVNKAFTYWASIKGANPDDPNWVGPWSTNWWENSNGVPRRFGPIGVVMKEALTEESMDLILSRVNKEGSADSGQNALWNTQNALYWSLAAGDSAQLKKVVENNLAVNLRVGGLTDEAIQVDNTFHCHGYQLYTNGYGKSLFSDMALWIDLLAGTDYALSQDVLDLMADYMLGGTRWMIRGDLLELADGYKGSGKSASGYIEPLQRMIKNDPKNAAEYKKVLDSITGDSGTTYNGANGNNYMWTSALMSHMREDYGVNVRMNNRGMKSTEWRATWPGTDYGNLIFWTADGTASVMIDGDEYNSVYDTYDWRHVPGVTAPFALATHYGFDNDANDCWGVSDGTYGATAYTFYKHDGTNKRTWGQIGYFFFDDEYVALGAGIGSNHDAAIHTTLNQTKAGDDVSVNGETVATGTDDVTYQADYVYNNKIGYVFPQQTEVHVSNLNHTDKKYPSVRGLGYSDTEGDHFGTTEEDTFSLWIDHGTKPESESYAYIVLPNKTEEDVAAYSESNQITIVANTEKVQAVRHEGLKQTQINFYEAGTLEYDEGKTVSVDGPCSLIIDESGSAPVISEAVSNTLENTLVNVSLTIGEDYTVTTFCSQDEPYAGRPAILSAGGSTLMQSSATAEGHSAANAFDKNLETYWESGEQPAWISYDMRDSLYVGSLTIHWGEDYATKYELQYSENGVDWETVYTQENGQGGSETVPFNVIGRYWRLRCLESSGDSYQIKEIGFATSSNIALDKPATASYCADDKPAEYAVDGDMSTRWVGTKGKKDDWIYVDLGANTRIDGVRVSWEASCASEYTIDVSDNGETWETVQTVTHTPPAGEKTVAVQTALPTGVTGRYLRIKGVEMALPQYGLSIWEIEIYGSMQFDGGNASLGRPATDAADVLVETVTDGETDTVWMSNKASDFLTIDLGENHRLDRVEVVWGEPYATGYKWQLSSDGSHWEDAAVVSQGKGGTESVPLDLNARYVRLVMEQSAGTGYAVAEVNAYGAAVSQLNPDKSALKQAIDTRVRDDVYTAETYAAYQAALAVANGVYASVQATKDMVDEATQDLLEAIENLTFRDFGDVLATISDQTATKTNPNDILSLNWSNLSQEIDLSKEDLNKIYLFAIVNITRDPNEEIDGLLNNGQIRLRATDDGGKERSVYVNTRTFDLHLGENILYFPLSEMIVSNEDNGMDWSTVNRFRMYIDSVNKFTGPMTMSLTEGKIIRTTEPAKVKVAVVGDSITQGSGASSTSKNYVSQLQNLLGSRYTVQNFGNSGKTLLKEDANGYTKTDTYKNSIAFEPDVVTIMLGTNDSKDATWNAYGDKYEQELRELVQAYRDLPSHPTVILATSPTAYNRNWNINDEVITGTIAPIQRKVAEEMGCPLIDANAATKNAADKFADGIHPNDAGHALLAQLFAEGITEAATRVYSFTLAGQTGTIDLEKGTISVTVPYDTDVTGLTPEFGLMAGATVSPEGEADFTQPVTYTVTAPDQLTTKEYVVTVTKQAAPAVNKDDLKKALDEKITDLTPYTPQTAQAYTQALEKAQSVYDDPQATQEAVDQALADLTAAQNALVSKPVYALGDVNGDGEITATDALLALQAATGKLSLNEAEEKAADVNSQSGVTSVDALLILQFATQKISHF